MKTKHTHRLIRSLVLALCVSAPLAALAQAVYTADDVAVGKHCVSEASGARTDDCAVIAWIDAQQAARRGIPVALFVAQTYTRHTASRTRPWISGLNAERTRPTGWPDDQVSWDRVGQRGWTQTLDTVHAVLSGTRSHGCTDGTPITWGGTMDTDGIARWRARGYRVLRCGDTRNRFIGR